MGADINDHAEQLRSHIRRVRRLPGFGVGAKVLLIIEQEPEAYCETLVMCLRRLEVEFIPFIEHVGRKKLSWVERDPFVHGSAPHANLGSIQRVGSKTVEKNKMEMCTLLEFMLREGRLFFHKNMITAERGDPVKVRERAIDQLRNFRKRPLERTNANGIRVLYGYSFGGKDRTTKQQDDIVMSIAMSLYRVRRIMDGKDFVLGRFNPDA